MNSTSNCLLFTVRNGSELLNKKFLIFSYFTYNYQLTRQWSLLVLIFITTIFSCSSDEDKAANHLKNAHNYIATSELKDALIELKNVVQLNPKNDEAYFLLGDTYMNLGQGSLAAQSYISAVTVNPGNLKAQLKLGQLLLATNQIEQAKNSATLILQKTPDDIDGLRFLSAVQLEENDQSGAIQTLKKAVEVDPKNITVRLYLAYLLVADGDLDGGEKQYREVLVLDDSNPSPYAALGNIYAQKGDWDKAEAVIDRLKQLSGNNYHELSALGQFCENSGKLRLAEKIYSRIVEFASPGNPQPWVELGTFYARRQSFEKALAAMQTALDINKDDPIILSNIGRVYLELGNIDAAEASVDSALKLDSKNALADYTKGRICFLRRDFNNALKRFDETIDDDPNNALAHYYRALCLIQKGAGGGSSDVDLFRAAAGFKDDSRVWIEKAAIESLDYALKLNPQLVEAQLVLADLYLRRRDLEAAHELIENALTAAPDHPQALVLKGGFKILQKDFKGAEAVCVQGIRNNPDDSLWYLRHGVVLAILRRYEEALKSYHKAIELNPFQLGALHLIVSLHMQQNHFDQALAVCEKHKILIADNRPAVALVENLEGKIFLARREAEKARRSFESAIVIGPEVVSPRMALAELDAKDKQFDSAISQYEAVLRINPNHLPACVALGDIYYIIGNTKKAEQQYRHALSIENDYGPAANNLAFILSNDDNKLREALDFADIAEKKMPNDAQVKDTLGWIHYRIGNFYKAISELEKSLSIEPNGVLSHYHLGLSYYKTGDVEKAQRELRKALKIDPGFVGAKEARTLLDK